MTFTSKLSASAIVFFSLGLASAIFAQNASVSRKTIHPSQNPQAKELNNLLATAQEAMTHQDYATAADSYEKYIAIKSDDAAVHFQLGYVYTALGRPADAKTEYEKTIALNPKMPEAYLNLGLTLLSSDPKAAVPPLEKFVALQPHDARATYLLGVALEGSGQTQEAIEQYTASLEIDEQSFDAHFALGRALLKANRFGDAEAQFRKAIALKSEDPPAHLGLAQCLLAEKKPEAAASEYETYLEAHPNDAAIRVERAALLNETGKSDEALSELDRAASAGPASLRALKLRAQIYSEKKQFDNAIAALQKAAAIAPGDKEIAVQLGHLYLEKKNYPDAVTQLIAAFKQDPSSNEVLKGLITAQYLNKNYPAALQGIDLLSKRETLAPPALFIRASCYDKLGQAVEALSAYKIFLQANKEENNDMYFEASARVRSLAKEIQDKKR